MAIRQYTPTTPGRRGASVADFVEITWSTPEKSLLVPSPKTGGRNNSGKITTRHIGGGHKQAYRLMFRRTERIRVQWPLAGAIEGPTARLLGRDGVPLELPVALTEQQQGAIKFLVADLNLAPLTAGDYVIEVTCKTAGMTETAMFAFRVGR